MFFENLSNVVIPIHDCRAKIFISRENYKPLGMFEFIQVFFLVGVRLVKL
jgi:hypothetical protein